jgi:WD40 repeat protein
MRSFRWTVTDTNLSPDGKFMIYTSMSHLVHLANVTGEYDYQEPLNIAAPTGRHSGGNFGVLSACFLGSDAHTIVAGTNAHSLHVYDVERKQLLTHVPDAHSNDINSVCFADPTSQVSSAPSACAAAATAACKGSDCAAKQCECSSCASADFFFFFFFFCMQKSTRCASHAATG